MSGSSRSWGCAPQAHQYFRSILWSSKSYSAITSSGDDTRAIGYATSAVDVVFADEKKDLTYENMLNANKENFYLDWQVQSFYTYEQEQIKYSNFRLVGFAKISELYANASYDTSSSPITSAKSAAHDGVGKCLSAYLPIRTTENKIAAQTLTCYPAWADSERLDTWAYLWYDNAPKSNLTFDVTPVSGSSEILDSDTKIDRSEWMLSVTYNACAFMQEESMSSINSSVNDIAGSDSSPWHSTVEAGVTHQCIPYSAHYTINRHIADSVTYITSCEINVDSCKFITTGSIASISIPINSGTKESLYYYSNRDYITPNPIYPSKSVVSRKLGVYDNMPINQGGSQISGWRVAYAVCGFAGLISRPCVYSPHSSTTGPSEAPSTSNYSTQSFYYYLTSLSLSSDDSGNYIFEGEDDDKLSSAGTLYYSASSVSFTTTQNYTSTSESIVFIFVPKIDGALSYKSAQRMDVTVTMSVDADSDFSGEVTVTVKVEFLSTQIKFSFNSSVNGQNFSISYTVYSSVDEDYEGVLSSCEDDLPMSYASSWNTGNRLLRNIVYNSIDETCCWQDEAYSTSRDGWGSQAAQWGNGNLATHTLDRYKLRTFPTSSCRLSYKTLAHNIIVLGLDSSDYICKFIPIPGTKEYNKSCTSITAYAPCGTSLEERKFKYTVTSDIIENATVPVVEVYRDSLDETRLYGQTWISCGEAVDIQSIDTSKESATVVMECTEGDSYYQSWDCYHCGPYSSDSINSVIDTFKLPIESWTNLHGRYDVYRTVDDLLGVDMDDFFKVNEVYSQHNNLVTYTYHSSTQSNSVDEFPTSIVWSSAMSYGVDNDPWSEIYLTNMCYLDGNCGAVNSLNLFNNNLYAFQDRGLSVIKYNENVQLESSATASISLGNSGAVDGYDLIAKDLGVTDFNKVYVTHENMYFADHNRQAIFSIGQKGINNLSDLGGFHSFFQAYDSFSDSWSPGENKGLKLLYDAENTELMIQMEDETLTYNEQLNKFCSFFDYKNYSSLTYINGYNIATTDESSTSQLHTLRTGTYNEFFGTSYDYSLTLLPNADPTKDKVWTNIDMRSDKSQIKDVLTDVVTFTSGTYTTLSYGAPLYAGNEGTHYVSVTYGTLTAGKTYYITGTITNKTGLSLLVRYGTVTKYTMYVSSDPIGSVSIDNDETVELCEAFTAPTAEYSYFAILFVANEATNNTLEGVVVESLSIAQYTEAELLTRSTFDTIQVWNEYQDSGTKKLTELQPVFSPLKEKFRIWRVQLPRDSEKKFDRIRNPWCYIKLSSDIADDNDNCKFVLHDINVWYV